MASGPIETARIRMIEQMITALQNNLATEITTVKATIDPSGDLTITAPASTDYYVATREADAVSEDFPNNAIVVYPIAPRIRDQFRSGSASTRKEIISTDIGVLCHYRYEAGDNEFSRSWKSNLETSERNLYAREILNGAIVKTIYENAPNGSDVLRLDLVEDDAQFVPDNKPQTTYARTSWRVFQKVNIPIHG